MRPAHTRSLFASAAVLAFAAASSAKAEEGMWTYDNFPIARANQTLGTSIDQAWLDRVRQSSVKFGGCSAGRHPAQGRGSTNNHCGPPRGGHPSTTPPPKPENRLPPHTAS